MNRPFMAFGTLMTFLTMAMFAVSSTSRSTTVQPPSSGNRSTSSTRNVAEQRHVRCSDASDTAKRAGDENRSTVLTAWFSPSAVELRDCASQVIEKPTGAKQRLTTVRVEVAAIPDGVVYGVKQDFQSPLTIVQRTNAPISTEDEVQVFGSILNRPFVPPSPSTSGNCGPTPSVDWSEYSAMMASLPRLYAVNAETADISDATGSVRSSDWLRYSAASSLSRVGQMLQAVGVILDAAAGPMVYE